MAENHELAFGLSYSCTFMVENKSGRELNVKIKGKSDKGIKFEYSAEESIEKVRELTGEFFVEPISEDIDIWKMHPCILADIWINNKHAELGLGIEPKYPLNVNVFEKRHSVTRPGMLQDVYINVKSALPKKARVSFTIPENTMTHFLDGSFTLDIEPDKTEMLTLREIGRAHV